MYCIYIFILSLIVLLCRLGPTLFSCAMIILYTCSFRLPELELLLFALNILILLRRRVIGEMMPKKERRACSIMDAILHVLS
jgi:hypothetical protein